MARTTKLFFLTALLTLPVAALLHLVMLAGVSSVWGAFVNLTIFGWVTAMIYAVSYHTMPVFTTRQFPYPRVTEAHGLFLVLGNVLCVVAVLVREVMLVAIICWAIASLLFMANSILLIVRGKSNGKRMPAPPIANQPEIDRVGILATKVAVVCLPIAFVLIIGTQAQWIAASWLLAGEHLATLGWIMLMIIGVAYHVFPRFSGQAVRSLRVAIWQVRLHIATTLFMVLSLGFGWTLLFAVGGVAMSVAIGLFGWNIWSCVRVFVPRPMPIRVTVKEQIR